MVLDPRPGSDLQDEIKGSKGQNSIFSEYGHVAYQIKGNHECSNMVANILPTDPHLTTPPPPTLEVQGS